MAFKILFQIYLLNLVCSSLEGKLISHVFEVSYIEGAPDGVNKGSILSINGQFPAPTIEGEIGDTLEVLLVNSIQDGQNTSLHWHGIHVADVPFEDGASMITQCPLKNGQIQRYVVPLVQAGTYWYHSHVGVQYGEGLWGALIVHNKPEVYNYDDEILITLSDWYHRTSKENEVWYLSRASRGIPPYPDSGLLNSLGRYPCNYAELQNRTCNTGNQKRAVFKVSPEKTYRVRVINVAAYATFNFSIEGHKLDTIEVDGTDVARPVTVDVATLSAGERYSFLVRTNGAMDRYLIRAEVRKEMLALVNGNINPYPEALLGDLTAVLEYSDDPSTPIVTSEPHSYLDIVPPAKTDGAILLDEDDLTPYDGVYAPDYFNQTFTITMDSFTGADGVRRATFNETPCVLPDKKPLLMTLLDGEPIPEGAFPLEIGYMNVVELVMNNPTMAHPLHLHGHEFWVMGTGAVGEGNYDPSKHNLILTGARRDTVLVQERSWAVIRFVADNPGVWPFHCHIDWHILSGMSLTFIEGREVVMSRVKLTDEARRVCDMWQK